LPPQSDPNQATLNDPDSSSASNQKQRSATNDLVGKLIGGRYRIEQELARGGIGIVYLARDKPELMSRRVVVKVLLEDSLKNEWIVQKFHQEVESLTRLDDPGVLGVFDVGKLDDGAPFLVMQYVDGVSLRTQITTGGMGLERVARIMQQIGRTLSTAHARGIIHRDLKPENIMLSAVESGEELVKVIDFGIAKVKNSVIAPSTVTGLSTAGTIGYMSPEQLQAQKVTSSSDIYALEWLRESGHSILRQSFNYLNCSEKASVLVPKICGLDYQLPQRK
jgi:serine/threonine-protein kinase